MDTMGNDNLNLQNNLPNFIPEDGNEELRFLGKMRSDANFNGFHHSQFPNPPVSSHPNFAGSFSDSISYTNIDWSFDSSRLGLSPQNWSHSIFTNPKNKTNASFHVRSPELASIYRVPVGSQEDEGLHLIGCDRATNNHNYLQSLECEDQIDLNITTICSGFQPHCLQELDAETFDVGCQIGISSQSWFTHLESCLLRRDQSQKSHIDVRNFSSEFPTFAPSRGISATISVPDQSFEHHQSVGPSQPPENIGNSLTIGNQDAREFGPGEDSDIAKSYHNPPVFGSFNNDISFQAHVVQVLSASVSPDISSHILIQP